MNKGRPWKGHETYEDSLAHEREILRSPEVTVVNTGHQDVREEDTDVLVDLEPDGVEQTAAANQVPVEAPREQPHALIIACATEDVAEHDAVIVGEAEDRHPSEDREYPCGFPHTSGAIVSRRPALRAVLTLWNDLPEEHDDKDSPEQTHTFRGHLVVKVQCLEEICGGD